MTRNMKEMTVVHEESRPTTSSSSVDSSEDGDEVDLDFAAMRKGQSKWAKLKNILGIATEGDLAGFQIAWLLISISFLFLKIFDIHEMGRIGWFEIFAIPIGNFFITGWFDYILRKYRSAQVVESLRKKRFVVLWIVKIIGVIYTTAFWIWGQDGFISRFSSLQDYNDVQGVINYCTGSMICIFIAIVSAVFMSEMMITVVLINSEHNLSATRTPTWCRVVLLFLRPIVWVYNRTMVMFLCFYSLYGLLYVVFLAGAYTDYYCNSARVTEAQGVGVQMLLVPFTVPDYLLHWTGLYQPWKDVRDDKLLEAYVVAFLCQSFYIDALNSIWQFSRRFILNKLRGHNKLRGSGGSSHDLTDGMNDAEYDGQNSKALGSVSSIESINNTADTNGSTVQLRK